MSALARAVGISRLALYLHFPDRAQLLLAVVAHLDEKEQLQTGIDAVRQAPDAAARALDDCRHADPAASAAWRDRTGNRMRGAISIIERLRAEGRLEPTWTTTEAAALLWGADLVPRLG
jgi:AcrR family transcriptional regulator